MKPAFWRRALSSLLLLSLLLISAWPSGAQAPQPGDAPMTDVEIWLDETLADMTTADKIGQLFLVTFPGQVALPAAGSAEADIARLVQVFRIGGMIISPENENFANVPAISAGNEAGTPQQVLSLTTGLQTLAFTDSLPIEMVLVTPVTATTPVTPAGSLTGTVTATVPVTQPLVTEVRVTQTITMPAQGIPLLIAAAQEGNGYPYTGLRTGFTDLPSDMALGATWNDLNAQSVGQIVGQELAAVGVNFLLGPSLDVLSIPRPESSGDLSTRVFGGDPYWVGRMGQAYIRGVHQGSAGKVAAVGKHLPGLGASDRSLDEEVATVDRSLDALRLIELQPFFAVTRLEPVTDTVDALMTAHIRYRGFQGNIRYVTRPISLDAQGMQQIMAQAEFAPWRQAGGLLVSDSLGVPAIRRYYSPKLDSFPYRQIALEAFQAGNDLLNLSRFSLTDSWADQMRNIEDTVLFFRDRYEKDETFRARVEQSVRRILRLKRRICPDWSLSACTAAPEGLAAIGRSRNTVTQIAQGAVTLLYPPSEELALRLSHPPRFDENVVIFADARQVSECATCLPFYSLDPDALRDTMLRMYGPGGTGQIDPGRVNTFTFEQLLAFLEGVDTSPDLAPFIEDADWILFETLGYQSSAGEYSSITTLKRFLKEQTAGLETKNVIVMAYGAPYYLDTTEISKLTAYYGVYSKIDSFVEVSVQALFQEFVPVGKSPVTVEGVGYDLSEQLRPEPAQVIAVTPSNQPATTAGTPEPVRLKVGDPLPVRTSAIVDRNGNPVPDGTPVTFHAVYVDTEGLGRNFDATTVGGVAETTVTLEREGVLQITATSDPAFNSRPLEVRLAGEGVLFSTPTPLPTPTHTPTPTPTPTQTPTPTSTPEPTATAVVAVPPPPPPEPRVKGVDLLLALLGMGLAGGVVMAATQRSQMHSSDRAWTSPGRVALWSLVCGLAGYLFYGLGLPGSGFMTSVSPGLRGLLIGLSCGLLPLLGVAWIWARARYSSEPGSPTEAPQ
jgi:beta-N-acetylhexosaminidase